MSFLGLRFSKNFHISPNLLFYSSYDNRWLAQSKQIHCEKRPQRMYCHFVLWYHEAKKKIYRSTLKPRASKYYNRLPDSFLIGYLNIIAFLINANRFLLWPNADNFFFIFAIWNIHTSTHWTEWCKDRDTFFPYKNRK